MPGTYAERLVAKDTFVVDCITGRDADGAQVYAILSVRADQYPAYRDALHAGPVRLEDHGVVLAKGEGNRPPEEVIAWLRDHFDINYNTDKEPDITAAIQNYIRRASGEPYGGEAV